MLAFDLNGQTEIINTEMFAKKRKRSNLMWIVFIYLVIWEMFSKTGVCEIKIESFVDCLYLLW